MKPDVNEIKKIILGLISSAAKGDLLNIIKQNVGSASGITTVAATSSLLPFSPMITIPVLLGVYYLYKHGENTIESDQKQKDLEQLLIKIKAEFNPQLEKIRNTTLTVLKKEMDLQLSGEPTIEEINALKELILSILENQEVTLESVTKDLQLSQTGITELLKDSNKIQSILNTISCDTTALIHGQQKAQFDITKGLTKLDEVGRQITDLTEKFNNQPSLLLQRLLSSETSSLKIKTGFTPQGNDAPLDSALQLVWDNMFRGRLTEAQSCLTKISSVPTFNDSFIAKTWISALQAKIHFMSGDYDKGIKAVTESETLLQSAPSCSSQHILKTIYARKYILQGEKEKARIDLKTVIDKEPIPEAKALWLSISGFPCSEILGRLTEDEKEDPVITQMLAEKFLSEKEYTKAELYARKSIENAKKTGAHPPLGTLATVLLEKRFVSPIITAGFSSSFIDPAKWSDFYEIKDLYEKSLVQTEEFLSQGMKSTLYHNLALVHFVCNKVDDTVRYVDKFFQTGKKPLSLATACIAMLLNLGEQDKALEKIKGLSVTSPLPPDLLYRYGVLLLARTPTEKEEGVTILTNIIIKAETPNSPVAVNAAICLGSFFQQEQNAIAFSSLINQLDKKSEVLARTILEADKLSKSDFAGAQNLLSQAQGLFPKNKIERYELFGHLIPRLSALKLWGTLLSLVEDAVPMGEITQLGMIYLEASTHANDPERVGKYCKSLREAGLFDISILQHELVFVLSYSPKRAEALAADISTHNLEPNIRKVINLLHDLAALKAGISVGEVRNIDDYPTIEQVDNNPFPFCNVPFFLKNAKFYNAAVRYAYEMYLRFPKDPDVRRILYNIIIFDSIPCNFQGRTVITEDSVFTYGTSKDDPDKKTIIIENTSQQDSRMRSVSDDIVKQVMGKNVGFEFHIENRVLGTSPFKILSVENKYIYIANQLMRDDAYLPGTSIGLIRTPTTSSGIPDLSHLIQTISNQQEIRKESIGNAQTFFKETYHSFYIFQCFSGLDIRDAIRYVTQQPELFIQATTGSLEEKEKVLVFLNEEHKKVLLSSLTIELLVLLDAVFGVKIIAALQKSKIHFCVSEYVYGKFANTPYGVGTFLKPYVKDGTLGITEDYIAECCQASGELMHSFLSTIEKIEGVLKDEAFEKDDDSTKIKWIFGKEYFHAMEIASGDPNIAVWDDDMYMLEAFHMAYGLKKPMRVFSQAFFLYLQMKEILSSAETTKVIIFLLTVHERFTGLNAETLFEIFQSPDKYPIPISSIAICIRDEDIESNTLLPILIVATRLLATKYTNLRRVCRGLKMFYDILGTSNQIPLSKILVLGLYAAWKDDKRKSNPIIAYLLREIGNGWGRGWDQQALNELKRSIK